ncbi:MAG: UDP-galactose-lipid carrier transferase, partial [Ilumatobacteraceae bacterium]
PEEQLRRFESRRDDPLRRWKLTDEDWRNRDKIDQYTKAIEDMFERTDHELSPWHVVSGEQKRWTRVSVVETLVERVEAGLAAYERPISDDDGWV